jgi:hypothetical protein
VVFGILLIAIRNTGFDWYPFHDHVFYLDDSSLKLKERKAFSKVGKMGG